jgi:hypothetical protein
MRRHKKLQRVALSLSIILAGGTVLGDGCINTLASIPVCGTLLTFCTPQDQLNLMFGMLDLPNYNWDASCTVPYGCGTGDLYNPTTTTPPGTPGGNAPDQPSLSQTGTASGGT